MLITSKDIPGLRRLIAAALRRGLSAERIVELIQKAMAGIFTPQGGFSDRDLDIAFLVKAIGGLRLLYALQNSYGLPSEATIRHQRKIPHLLSAIVNNPGNPRVKISDPYPYPLDPYPSNPRVYPSKNDQKQPKTVKK